MMVPWPSDCGCTGTHYWTQPCPMCGCTCGTRTDYYVPFPSSSFARSADVFIDELDRAKAAHRARVAARNALIKKAVERRPIIPRPVVVGMELRRIMRHAGMARGRT